MNRPLTLAAALSVLLAGACAMQVQAQSRDEAPRAQQRADAADWRGDRRQGRYDNLVPLERLVADATRRYPGTVTEVDLDDGRYEIEIRQRNGREVELTYSARSGELLHEQFD